MKKIAVCLSGCGFLDGAEIQESVLTLLAIDQAGAKAVCCAPDINQAGVVDHLRQEPAAGTRNVLVESARIARGDIVDVKKIRAAEMDALIFPGGFGAAKNLCSFATDGANCNVNPDVERLTGEFLAQKKPIGAICIAPAMLARIVGRKDLHPRLTIGTDKETADAINAMGAQHRDCPVTEMITDEKYKIVSTPAYMLGQGPAEVFEGIRKLVTEVLRLCAA
ncbi:MAG: isoprenoid biosynthesis glyoxalase ElbB [Planctomycetia bacterium]|nr:isoprenoid biosynthesis glyoxalase ElbB [Planctomycetia bacterium]MCC7314024.1 isoprenoid biosynthesis glyoxalase ElbB [Planctomycetota bacterium]OQY99285.1 MAG: isoprenoid biosynthesis protein ElbB [Planctomycetes bacterium UTPLA1]